MIINGVRPRTFKTRVLLFSMAFGTVLAGASMPAAKADPIVGCQSDLWGFLFSQRRVLCDGPIRPDGTWLRQRVVFTPAHQVPLRTNCYGTYYVSCTTTGGYYQPYSESDNETYPVTVDTVLGDEPGHLVNNMVPNVPGFAA